MNKHLLALALFSLIFITACADDIVNTPCPVGYTAIEGQCIKDDLDGQGNAECGLNADVIALITDSSSGLALDISSLAIIDATNGSLKIYGEKPLGYPTGAYVLPNVNTCHTFWGSVEAACYAPLSLVPVKINSDTIPFSMDRIAGYDDCVSVISGQQLALDACIDSLGTLITCCAMFGDAAFDVVCNR